MKRKLIFYIVSLIVIFGVILVLSPNLRSSILGVPSGFTGSPIDGVTCATMNCHPGPPIYASGWITTSIPASGYIPADTYDITMTATRAGSPYFGFQISALTEYMNQTTLLITDTPETQYAQMYSYLTHKKAGTNGINGSKTWTCKWIAPSDTYQTYVTFYASFFAGEKDVDEMVYYTDLVVFSKFHGMDEIRLKGFSVYPNPASDFLTIESQRFIKHLELYDLNGKQISLHFFPGKKIELELPQDQVSNGLYILRISTEKEVFSYKLFIEKK